MGRSGRVQRAEGILGGQMETEQTGSDSAYAKWHWLARVGFQLMFVAAIGFVASLFIPTSLPVSPHDVDDIYTNSLTYQQEVNQAKFLIGLHAILVWACNKLLAAGFFMWLAGHVVNAIRHPESS